MPLNPKNLKNGEEQYETFASAANGKSYVQYDYRNHRGILFSCVKKTLDECRAARDQWINRHKSRQYIPETGKVSMTVTFISSIVELADGTRCTAIWNVFRTVLYTFKGSSGHDTGTWVDIPSGLGRFMDRATELLCR